MKQTKKMTVLLIFGGMGHEKEVSIEGAKFVSACIDREKYRVIPVYITPDGEWLIRKNMPAGVGISGLVTGSCERISVFPAYRDGTSALIGHGAYLHPDCAIPLLHGDLGEDGVVQGALECAKIPYVGCGVRAGAIISDKGITKIVAESLGIPVARWMTHHRGNDISITAERAEDILEYPMFVKPATLGSSIGAAKAASREELIRATAEAEKLSYSVLIEECLDIEKELECAYFGTKGKEIFTNIGEITYPDGFYDYSTKYGPYSTASVRALSDVSEDIAVKIRKSAEMLCRNLGVRHLSRIDFFLTRDGRLLFNEINTFPGFTAGSLYPRLLSRCGISASRALSLLINDAISDATEVISISGDKSPSERP